VLGGKSHEFLVELSRVLAGHLGQSDDRVFANADQSCGLTDATTVGEVPQDVEQLVVGQATVEQRRAFAFGETGLAATAVQQTLLLFAVVAADGQICLAPLAVQRARGVLAAETAELVHARWKLWSKNGENDRGWLQVTVVKSEASLKIDRTPPGYRYVPKYEPHAM
jgi:hypothetical protein